MSAPVFARQEIDEACARCDGRMVITLDAIGRPRKRCPRCDGVSHNRRHPDEVLIPQGLVRVTPLPAIEPGQLRCQVCAVGINPALRFCDPCRIKRERAVGRACYHRARGRAVGTVRIRCRCGAPRPPKRGALPKVYVCEDCK